METRKVNMGTGEILEEETNTAEEAVAMAGVEATEAEGEPGEVLDSLQTGTAALVRIAPGKDQAISQYLDQVLSIQQYAQGLAVVDLESDKRATEDVTMVKKLRTDIEAEQKAWLAPLKEHEKVIRDAFALLLGPLDVANQTLRDKIVKYREAQAAIRAEQERVAELQRQANEAALKLAQETKAETVELQAPVEVTAPEVVQTVRMPIGTSSLTGNWKWEWRPEIPRAERMAKLPIEYHMADETKIGQAVRAMKKNPITEKDFGGTIRIWEEKGVRITER